MCEGVKGYRKLLGTLVNVGAFASIINDGHLIAFDSENQWQIIILWLH